MLECEGLNERNPFCQSIRILRLYGCWEENAAFSSVIGGPAIILEGRVIQMTVKLTNHNHIVPLNGWALLMTNSARCAL